MNKYNILLILIIAIVWTMGEIKLTSLKDKLETYKASLSRVVDAHEDLIIAYEVLRETCLKEKDSISK